MFLHVFRYNFLQTLRQKEVMFWMILFPVVLATFFHIAFSSIYDKEFAFDAIPAAVVETEENAAFKSVINSVSEGDEALFKTEYLSEEEALDRLEENEISVIFVTSANDVSMKVKSEGIRSTIAESFLSAYKTNIQVITDTVKNNPSKLQEVTDKLSAEISTNENIPLTDGNMNVFIQYFYNLIAMVCLYGAISGLYIAANFQANLDPIGARNCCSPTNKLKAITADLLAKYIVQVLCVSVSIAYITFILKEDMGNRIHIVFLSGALGCMLGTSFGFFVGSIGRLSLNAKTGICMSITMFGCFLSGLMVGDMKAIIAEHCPIVNRLNPAAMISDLFYCLNVYKDYRVYTERAVLIVILTAVFTLGGFIFTRRKKYASI